MQINQHVSGNTVGKQKGGRSKKEDPLTVDALQQAFLHVLNNPFEKKPQELEKGNNDEGGVPVRRRHAEYERASAPQVKTAYAQDGMDMVLAVQSGVLAGLVIGIGHRKGALILRLKSKNKTIVALIEQQASEFQNRASKLLGQQVHIYFDDRYARH